ncbi:MAG TPA: hypothetical protein VHV51_14255 [Polyangiaceae bacterium]|nr:hypothetical protein [Polyangiaceae bacterium]
MSAYDGIAKSLSLADAALAREKEVNLTLKNGQEELKRHMHAGDAARKKSSGPASSGDARVALLQTAHDEYSAVVAEGQTLDNSMALLSQLQKELSSAAFELGVANYRSRPELDATESLSLMNAISTEASQVARREKTSAALAAAASVKADLDEARKNVEKLNARVSSGKKEAQTALAAIGPAARNSARTPTRENAQGPWWKDVVAAHMALDDIDGAIKAASQSGSGGTRGACAIEKVDFRNFQYRDGGGDTISMSNGKSVQFGSEISVNRVDYAELDGSGSKQAIVFINLPGRGPQGSDSGLLYFFGWDASCSLKLLGSVQDWNVKPLKSKSKSYVYRQTVYGGEPGNSGDSPADVDVEVHVVNGKLKELKRVAAND